MSRLADADFQNVLSFIESYSLSFQTAETDFVASIRRVHKRHLALLTLWAHIADVVSAGSALKFGTTVSASPAVAAFLEQSVADASESFFSAIHGAYKAAHMLLRSSVENYVRAFSMLTDPSAKDLTSVYKLFELARGQEFFQVERNSFILSSTKGLYSELCGYVHSGVPAHSAPVHALAHFPVCEAASLARWVEIFCKVATGFIESLVTTEPDVYRSLHFKEQDLIGEAVSPAILRALHNHRTARS